MDCVGCRPLLGLLRTLLLKLDADWQPRAWKHGFRWLARLVRDGVEGCPRAPAADDSPNVWSSECQWHSNQCEEVWFVVQEGELREPNWRKGQFSVTSARVFLWILSNLYFSHPSSRSNMMSKPSLLAQLSSSCTKFPGLLVEFQVEHT